MKKVILLNKKEGETPLEALEIFRIKNNKYKDIKMTYAGRLDPMASGLLLILAGEETKNKEKYLVLDKEYDFEVTFDVLGKVLFNYELSITNYELKNRIKSKLQDFLGEQVQKYPIYSSKTVAGKPLFTYARAGDQVEIPERKIVIKKLELEKIRTINNKKLFQNIEKRIKKVKSPARNAKGIAFAGGDFRQKEILKIWKNNLSIEQGELLLKIASFKIKCSSGTYVRGIANSLGNRMKIPALAFSIKRTKVGKYML